MPWHPVPRRAACTYLRAGALTCSRRIGAVTCGRLIKLRLAYILCFIIRKLRLALGVCIGFLQCGIPHRTCRFYCCLAAHQRTKEKDSAEPLSSILWTPPPHPGVIRCGGAYLLPRAYTNLGSLYPMLSFIPSSEYGFAICVRAGIVRVSVGLLGCGRSFFIIGGMDCSYLRLRGVWLWSIVGFALTANGSAIWRMKGRGSL